jgi:hypothetical protein
LKSSRGNRMNWNPRSYWRVIIIIGAMGHCDFQSQVLWEPEDNLIQDDNPIYQELSRSSVLFYPSVSFDRSSSHSISSSFDSVSQSTFGNSFKMRPRSIDEFSSYPDDFGSFPLVNWNG